MENYKLIEIEKEQRLEILYKEINNICDQQFLKINNDDYLKAYEMELVYILNNFSEVKLRDKSFFYITFSSNLYDKLNNRLITFKKEKNYKDENFYKNYFSKTEKAIQYVLSEYERIVNNNNNLLLKNKRFFEEVKKIINNQSNTSYCKEELYYVYNEYKNYKSRNFYYTFCDNIEIRLNERLEYLKNMLDNKYMKNFEKIDCIQYLLTLYNNI